ncbi:hypothetical protein K432DRAFT_389635 [Lepidopterella palustris CBS 459.81]|uniref:RING-type E3 ubiquitin transferase n=1 Tax=Lepidopterella palustris CBS 459.81 TaxID=1314670 RepID=A0A8E2JJ07_9PEZI|nr:hypothetical protein K432DRAFT_389635 [Lepidopterella palustris CBS 459.81]
MDRPTQQPAQPQQPAARDMVYCHECENEWYRDEHGLTCPECGSDFTEIIEADHDPRDERMLDEEGDDLPDLPPLLHPFHNHQPWRVMPDPDEGDVNQIQWRQNGPHSFSVTGTIYRSYTPNQHGGNEAGHDHDPPPLMGFANIVQNIIGAGIGGGQRQTQEEANQTAGGEATPGTPAAPGATPNPQPNPNHQQGGFAGGPRFHYHQTARLFPRDANNAQPHLEPVDDMHNVIAQLFNVIGGPMVQDGPHADGRPQQTGLPPIHPFAALFNTLLNPGNAAHGDFVYSQEALDRIITQLMEQNSTGNAPGPATPDAIKALPKIKVTLEMLGSDNRAECSICMDEVNIGEEVTELPCHHWFHEQCVGMWLGEHDTCPHCRKGIMDHKKQNDSNNLDSSNTTASNTREPSDAAASSSSDPTSHMPGSYGTIDAETAGDPYTAPESPEQQRLHQQQQARPSSNRQPSSSSAHSDGSSGGLGERIRRGLFGAPR